MADHPSSDNASSADNASPATSHVLEFRILGTTAEARWVLVKTRARLGRFDTAGGLTLKMDDVAPLPGAAHHRADVPARVTITGPKKQVHDAAFQLRTWFDALLASVDRPDPTSSLRIQILRG
jgi:hypothetical protein